ncbi:MAG: DNA repair protein [Actinobacteria bacterium]|nr:MAG: DNA repair protein [Actinomycetota bacterium]
MKYATVDRQSDVELVATILGKKTNDEACTRFATVLATDGWMSGSPLSEVAREYGSVGPRSLAKIEAAVELGRRTLAARAARKTETISTPEDVAAVVRPLLVGQDREHFMALALDTKNHLKKVIEVSIGSTSASIVHPVPLFKELVAVAASSFVVVHNHPSGDPTPSGADIQLCRRIVKCADVMGCELLDFCVIGGDSHASLRELGLM